MLLFSLPATPPAPFLWLTSLDERQVAGSCLLSAYSGVLTSGSINMGESLRPTQACKSTAAMAGGLQTPVHAPHHGQSCLVPASVRDQPEGEGLAGDTPWTLSSASSHPAGPHSSQLCACARQDGGGEACVPSLPKSPVLAALWGLEVSLQPPSQSRTIPKDWGSPGFGPIFHPLL